MSLYWKLISVIAPLVILIFLPVTLYIMGTNSSHYLAEQLSAENKNDADLTARHLVQLDLPPVELETYLRSKFDQGKYRSVKLLNPIPDLEPRFLFESTVNDISYPRFLKALFPSNPNPDERRLTPISGR